MISTSGLTLQFGKRVLFKDVSIKFTPGNCYGIIGANGAGKSTFLRVLAGDIEPSKGSVDITPGERLAVLKQDHYAFDEVEVLRTVMLGHERLVAIMDEKDALYQKEDFSDADGMKASELEAEFADMNGWDAEPEAERLLNGLGIEPSKHHKKMADLTDKEKVRVLLAQALFGSPDVLLLDEPTNHLDMESKEILERASRAFPGTVLYVSHDRYFINRTATRILNLTEHCLVNYIGNYDYYLEKKADAERAAIPVTAPAPKGEENESSSTSAEDYKTQKAQKAAEKKRRAELEACEQRIAELEETLRGIEEEFLLPENQRDAAALLAIQKRKDSAEEELADCYERWETLAD